MRVIMLVGATICVIAVGLITYAKGPRWGLAAWAAFLLVVIAVAAIRHDRGLLHDAALGSLLGLPALLGALTARRNRTPR